MTTPRSEPTAEAVEAMARTLWDELKMVSMLSGARIQWGDERPLHITQADFTTLARKVIEMLEEAERVGASAGQAAERARFAKGLDLEELAERLEGYFDAGADRDSMGFLVTLRAGVAAAVEEARADERERCARMVEAESHRPGSQGYAGGPKHTDLRLLASAIRSLGLKAGGEEAT